MVYLSALEGGEGCRLGTSRPPLPQRTSHWPHRSININMLKQSPPIPGMGDIKPICIKLLYVNSNPHSCAHSVLFNNYSHAASWISFFPSAHREIKVRKGKQELTGTYVLERGPQPRTGDAHSAFVQCSSLEALNQSFWHSVEMSISKTYLDVSLKKKCLMCFFRDRDRA